MQASRILLFAMILAVPASLTGFQKKERVLWIETREHGELKASIAISTALAKHLLDENRDAEESPIDRDLITREMVDDVLSGRKESMESTDPKTGNSALLSLGTLTVPSAEGGEEGDLVIEVFKKGKRSFTLRLPQAEESEARDDDDPDITKMTFGWDSLMPFMAKTKGVVYVKDHDDDTEFWMFVD
jgi:hypothetical protein